MKRLIIYNPQAYNLIGKPIFDNMVGGKISPKYDYFCNGSTCSDFEICFLVDGVLSSAVWSVGNKFWDANDYDSRRVQFARNEFKLWCERNSYHVEEKNILTSFEEIGEDDVFFCFSMQFLDGNIEDFRLFDLDSKLSKLHNLKLCHISHYQFKTRKTFDNIRKYNFVPVYDVDLRSFDFYKKYAHGLDKFIFLPFCLKDDFKYIDNFNDRINKCAATGMSQRIRNESLNEYVDFYKSDTLHPIRREIFESASVYNDFIDSFIGDWDRESDIQKGKNIKVTASDLNDLIKIDEFDEFKDKYSRLVKKYLFNNNIYYYVNQLKSLLELKIELGTKKLGYYDLSMVEIYSGYKFFLVGEEGSHSPGIGFLEGMAIGSVYFGSDSKIYEQYGLVDGLHYLHYGGNLNRIRTIMNSRVQNFEEISRNGAEYVTSKFGKTSILKRLRDSIYECG